LVDEEEKSIVSDTKVRKRNKKANNPATARDVFVPAKQARTRYQLGNPLSANALVPQCLHETEQLVKAAETKRFSPVESCEQKQLASKMVEGKHNPWKGAFRLSVGLAKM
jgi:hypothetical protein